MNGTARIEPADSVQPLYVDAQFVVKVAVREVFPNFADYARNVRRLFPRWRAYGNGDAGFSSHLYWQHREYNAVLGTAAILAVLIAKLMWTSR